MGNACPPAAVLQTVVCFGPKYAWHFMQRHTQVRLCSQVPNPIAPDDEATPSAILLQLPQEVC
jgi:hypothetical protein